jgi:hypothetical protein
MALRADGPERDSSLNRATKHISLGSIELFDLQSIWQTDAALSHRSVGILKVHTRLPTLREETSIAHRGDIAEISIHIPLNNIHPLGVIDNDVVSRFPIMLRNI